MDRRDCSEIFSGYIIADAYPGYDAFFGPGKATEVACWVHTRRYFLRAESSDPELARDAIERIKKLYRIERQAKEAKLDPEGVLALRQKYSVSELERFRDWLSVKRCQVLDKSPMGIAIDYALGNWTALCRYTEDGRLPLDNNAAEQSLRAVAIGRKNWNFIGNEKGGRTAAVLFSLVETAKAAGIDPRTYLRDVLLRIGSETNVRNLTPHGWKAKWEPVVADHRADLMQRLVAHRAPDE